MKDLIERYIRSLTEQEPAKSAPEHSQDLGTFVHWLLERHQYRVEVRAFRHEGTERRSDRGRRQYGVDILASKADPDGTDHVCRLVLKAGNISRSQWVPGQPGTMLADLWEAAALPHAHDNRSLVSEGDVVHQVTVIAVHNGDVSDDIRLLVDEQCNQIRRQCSVDIEWWDASQLVEMTLSPGEAGDASLFPPAVRPFARLALDSLRRAPAKMGETFDIAAVDQLIEQTLPLKRKPIVQGARVTLSPPSEQIPIRRLYTAASELSLLAGMLRVACTNDGSGTSLPVLDTLPRIACRILEHARRLSSGDMRGFVGKLRDLLIDILDRYIASALDLRTRLEPLLDVDYSLAVPLGSERLDYPLRTTRLCGYLALAGLACLDRQRDDDARCFADALRRLARSNAGGLLSPVLDDQLIELAAIWMLWLRVGMRDSVGTSCVHLLERLAQRTVMGFPMPALYGQVRSSGNNEHLQPLVLAHLHGKSGIPGLIDTGSTIIPLALWLCQHTEHPIDEAMLSAFQASATEFDETTHLRVIYPQSWRPPDDAASEWYAHEIRHRGFSESYQFDEGITSMLAEFERHHEKSLDRSFAEDWNMPVFDWMAWCVWRTPPPMHLFVREAYLTRANLPPSSRRRYTR